ncbi:MAG: dihydropteroate synthase [Candidatus Kuenenia stuttgartiensis]|nr:dihydropteroate synthase [Candidatus Kuenenia stuttgartiensis]
MQEDTNGSIQENSGNGHFEIDYPRGKLCLGRKTLVMGVLNITPDSFYDGNKHFVPEEAIDHAHKMIEEGADIIDVGGESTRPGASPISEEEELKRVIPLIKILSKEINKPISIDTYKAVVAKRAIEEGASMVNDIGGLIDDENMSKVIAGARVPVVIMHKKGSPLTMQKNPVCKDLFPEIMSCLKRSISTAMEAGIEKSKIILDPGIGFGKTMQQNLEILKRLYEFKGMGYPLLIGTSRKNFIGALLNVSVQERLYGTLATLAVAIMNGANIIRVHDVKAAVHVATICDAIRNA